jgi:hypothetical protein
MQANLNKNVQIEEENRHAYHLKVESVTIDPRDAKHPIVRRRILVLRPIDYKKYFECSIDEQIGYLKAMGLENVELVHDPSIERIEKIVFPKTEEEKYRKERAVNQGPMTGKRRMK